MDETTYNCTLKPEAAPLCLDDWIDKHADDLRGNIVCHLNNVTSATPSGVETAVRMIMISTRQWARGQGVCCE